MKKINYFGKEYKVSDEVEWVATSWRGAVMAFTYEPTPTDCRWAGGACDVLDRLPVGNACWKDSLREVKDIIVKEDELKVGDKVELLDDYYGFKKGQIVELYELKDDGMHLFKGSNDAYSLCDGEGGAYLTSSNYKALTPLDDKKSLKIKCVDNKGNSYFTIGKEYECLIIDESFYKMANCDFSHLDHCYFFNLDNVHGTFEIVDEYKSHPHADLMLKYAMIAQYDDKPWESFECDMGDGNIWCDMITTGFQRDFNYRLKPQEPRIQIGQVWVDSNNTKVTIKLVSSGVVFFDVNIGGLDIQHSFFQDCFLQSFKCKE